jgi:hypothetical protein
MSELPIWTYAAILFATLLGMSALVYIIANAKRNRLEPAGRGDAAFRQPAKADPHR